MCHKGALLQWPPVRLNAIWFQAVGMRAHTHVLQRRQRLTRTVFKRLPFAECSRVQHCTHYSYCCHFISTAC